MGIADLHMHSVFSDGTATVSAALHYASEQTDLDVIAITDHDTLAGALMACDLASRFRVQVIPGMEISTSEGHLLALFVERPVPPGLTFVETAERVRLQGGLPFAPHPAGALVSSIGSGRLRRVTKLYPGLLAGVEAFNGSLPLSRANDQAGDLRWELQLPGIGNSDAHLLSHIGRGRTAFAGKTAADLRAALEAGLVVPLPAPPVENYLMNVAVPWTWRWVLSAAETLNGRNDDWHASRSRFEGLEPVLRLRRVRRNFGKRLPVQQED